MESVRSLNSRGAGLVGANGRQPKVAIVGGSPAGAMVATVLCRQFGCATVHSPTSEAVLALLRDNTSLDLIVVDLSANGMDGMVALQLIRALGARGALPVVALTSDRSEIPEGRTSAAGFASTVVKPYSPRELYSAMQAALGVATARAAASA